MSRHLDVVFVDSGREPKCPPNPAYPHGMELDLSDGAAKTCSTDVPYPAPRCGTMIVMCDTCDRRVGFTVAGRVDDPRKITIACRL